MPIPKNKKELQTAIALEYGKLIREFEEIEKHLVNQKSMEGHAKGSLMSPANLVSYLVGWGELVIKWERQSFQDIEIDFPAKGYKWTELGALAQQFYRDYEHLGFEQLVSKLAATKEAILQIIDNQTNEELYHRDFYKHYPFGRMIQLNTSSPYKNARLRIKKWKKSFQEEK